MHEIDRLAQEYLDSNTYKKNQKTNKELLQKARKFVRDYPIQKIKTMEFDEYVQGKGSQTSFCYRIEIELDDMGRIKGSDATKFGVYYSKADGDYRYTKKFGNNKVAAFARVKNEIIKIIQAAQENKPELIKDSLISENLKAKIYYLYAKPAGLPIFSIRHLTALLSIFGIENVTKSKDTNVYRDLLIKYKEKHEDLKKLSNLEFSQFIYSDIGLNPQLKKLLELPEGYVVEVIDITALNEKTVLGTNKAPRKGSHDETSNARKKAFGTRGEDVVLKYEKDQNPKYAHLIKKIAGDDDGAGYDILSYDHAGNEVRIEVKTKSGGSLNHIYFFISRNQVEKLRNGTTDYIYYVFGLNTKKVKIIKITNAMLKDTMLEPYTFLVNAEAIE